MMRRRGITTEYTTGTAGTPGETAAWTYNIGEQWDGTSPLLIALHGHGTVGTDTQGALSFAQNVGPASATMALAREGFIVLSIQAGGAAPWNKPSVMTTISAAVTAAQTRGCRPGPYNLLGWSMGGLHVAQRIKEDHANVRAAWSWCPAQNLYFVFSEASSPIKANNATWTSEVTAAHGSWAATAGRRVSDEPASFAGVQTKWRICHATDDSVIPYSITTDFVAAVGNPNITKRTPDVVGDHTNLFQYVPDQEIVDHFVSAN